jgi:hypothetical protein
MPLQNKFGEQHSSHTSTHEHMHTEGQVIEERPVAVGVAEVRLLSSMVLLRAHTNVFLAECT